MNYKNSLRELLLVRSFRKVTLDKPVSDKLISTEENIVNMIHGLKQCKKI